jgi:4-diphosphocytidyl-2-C-methyl-D-erythritol kinase
MQAGCSAVLRVFAPAKINLCLHVTGQRTDGYHLLDTLVGFADVGDVVTMQRGAPEMRVTGDEGAQLRGENIISAVLNAYGGAQVAVHLQKNLPIASGIGGGSSDAAAAYRGLCALLGRAPAPSDIAQLLAIGADVPMCVQAQPARVQGIGEQITPLPNLAPLHSVLVNPRVHVPTPSIFKALTKKENSAIEPLPQRLGDAAELIAYLAAQRNDLQHPAISMAPVIADVLSALAKTHAALVRMSGSGATCFGLYCSASAATAASAELSKAQPKWWVAPCTINGALDVRPQHAPT